MDYDEKIIDGMYYFRNTPNGQWSLMTNQKMASTIKDLKNKIKDFQSKKIHLICDSEDDTICGIDRELAVKKDSVTVTIKNVTCENCIDELN